MSFAALAGGAECGPVNPLAQLSKAYSNDRGVQQDHFSPQQGSSRQAFRGASGPSQALPDDAARFFQHAPHQQPFDMAPLGRALTPMGDQRREGSPAPAPPAWATAFAQQSGGHQVMPAPAAMKSAWQNGASRPQAAEWSGDFARMEQQNREAASRGGESQQMRMQSDGGLHSTSQARLFGAGFGGAAPMMMGQAGGMYGMQMGGAPMVQQHQYQQPQQDMVVQTKAADWESAFRELEASPLHAESIAAVQQEAQAAGRPASPVLSDDQARDALARTAGALLETVHSTERQRADAAQPVNDKFANSTFLDLMRKLRDGEVAVEGDKVVEQIGPARSVDKGKGRASGWASEFGREEEGRAGAASSFGISTGQNPASLAEFATTQQVKAQREAANAEMARKLEKDYQEMAGLWDDEDAVREAREMAFSGRGKGAFQGDGGFKEDETMEERTVEQMRMDTSVPLASSNWEEDFDASMISGGHSQNQARTTEHAPSAQQMEWDALQADWDNFEVTATGFKPVASTSTTLAGYGFAQNNPYLQSTRTHSMHAPTASSTYDSILQKEAAVQQNPNDSAAWLALGIKQQENEREELAIKALRRAVELDPELGEAYLALAVSYTNENERASSYESIDRWVDTLATSRYTREVDNYRDLFGKLPNTGSRERHEYLTGLLIQLAQGRAEIDGADVDAEVQIGLGVLFNTSEEYEKAGDCFESALSVRPDDPLLFNRLGATFANSGKTELAIQYYLEALDIQPGYVRARFNLAVANMNLGQYEEAIQHLITSLSIQEEAAQLEAGSSGNGSHGVTSQTLWDSLNICLLQMHRSDLATYTASRNLQAIVEAFPPTHN